MTERRQAKLAKNRYRFEDEATFRARARVRSILAREEVPHKVEGWKNPYLIRIRQQAWLSFILAAKKAGILR